MIDYGLARSIRAKPVVRNFLGAKQCSPGSSGGPVLDRAGAAIFLGPRSRIHQPARSGPRQSHGQHPCWSRIHWRAGVSSAFPIIY